MTSYTLAQTASAASSDGIASVQVLRKGRIKAIYASMTSGGSAGAVTGLDQAYCEVSKVPYNYRLAAGIVNSGLLAFLDLRASMTTSGAVIMSANKGWALDEPVDQFQFLYLNYVEVAGTITTSSQWIIWVQD